MCQALSQMLGFAGNMAALPRAPQPELMVQQALSSLTLQFGGHMATPSGRGVKLELAPRLAV